MSTISHGYSTNRPDPKHSTACEENGVRYFGKGDRVFGTFCGNIKTIVLEGEPQKRVLCSPPVYGIRIAGWSMLL
jgi:hypothetical protein